MRSMLFATIYIPDFRLQAALRQAALSVNKMNGLGSPASRPAALVSEDKKPLLLQLNELAHSEGVRIGMSPSQAMARCLELLLVSPSTEQEAVLQELLLEQAFTLSPYVEATASGIATVQFTDNRDRTDSLAKVIGHLQTCAISARAGLAPTPDVSYLSACLADPILQVNDANEFLAPLPLEVLLENIMPSA